MMLRDGENMIKTDDLILHQISQLYFNSKSCWLVFKISTSTPYSVIYVLSSFADLIGTPPFSGDFT